MQYRPAGIGHNGGPPLDDAPVVNLTEVLKRLRPIAALYNQAAAYNRTATQTLRDIRRDVIKKDPAYFEGLEDARKGAIDRTKAKFRERKDYQDAEKQKEDAMSAMRDAIKQAKAAGIDVLAMKKALHLQTLDNTERKDHFDNIDIYAKELGLWAESY